MQTLSLKKLFYFEKTPLNLGIAIVTVASVSALLRVLLLPLVQVLRLLA